jgi:hypothetical protein
MPLPEVGRLGTNADGSYNPDYCCYCFQSGRFTTPSITESEMVDLVANYWADRTHRPVEAARRKVAPRVAELKRWRSAP